MDSAFRAMQQGQILVRQGNGKVMDIFWPDHPPDKTRQSQYAALSAVSVRWETVTPRKDYWSSTVHIVKCFREEFHVLPYHAWRSGKDNPDPVDDLLAPRCECRCGLD